MVCGVTLGEKHPVRMRFQNEEKAEVADKPNVKIPN